MANYILDIGEKKNNQYSKINNRYTEWWAWRDTDRISDGVYEWSSIDIDELYLCSSIEKVDTIEKVVGASKVN